MKCAVHAERDVAGYCRNCGRPMCAECTRAVHGVLYCEDCLASLLNVTPAPAVKTPNAGLAATLGFIPGLGAIYNGEYLKGIIHIAVFAGIIAMLHNPLSEGMETFLGIGLACFYFYMPIDAYRSAKARQAAASGTPHPAPAGTTFAATPAVGAPGNAGPALATGPIPAAPPAHQPGHVSPVTGAVILIVVGVLVLLANLGMLEEDWLGHWWPLILVGLGIWLLWERWRQPAAKGNPWE